MFLFRRLQHLHEHKVMEILTLLVLSSNQIQIRFAPLILPAHYSSVHDLVLPIHKETFKICYLK